MMRINVDGVPVTDLGRERDGLVELSFWVVGSKLMLRVFGGDGIKLVRRDSGNAPIQFSPGEFEIDQA